MDKETLINEFLGRIESTFSADVEIFGEYDDYELKEEFDRQAARGALDRLFKDLKDFAGESK